MAVTTERKATFPKRLEYRLPRREQGAHLSLHRCLTPRLRRDDTDRPHEAYDATIRILHRQRTATRNFASQMPMRTKYLQSVSDRLHAGHDSRYKPAESRDTDPARIEFYTLTPKPIYTAAEVREIVNRVSSRSGLAPCRIPSRKGFYPADLVVQILQANHAARPATRSCREGGPNVAADLTRDVRSSEGDVDATTKRVAWYDGRATPAESKWVRAATPTPHPEQILAQGRRMTEEERHGMVVRLTKSSRDCGSPEQKPKQISIHYGH
ncbi:hypothetical protein CAPTEDRAFT_224694 [Capitella teleta]|uniref:Uncharacterized protein n=1 Tax=Capitella teleta TaxID=283909 RepID=R7V051_CAPTE|nr:hypothetical protein CAPTEDRAFT_224694 [Capitella teleta]|eukprot:ELU09046.1 hypothetical protein CAPTEDRAFT_224694 [Capitella teleta]